MRFFPNHASAVSEANGTTVSVSLDLGSSLSITPSEGSRSRVRRTRGAMGIQSISAQKALPDGDFGQKVVIDAHRCRTSRNLVSHPTSAPSVLQEGSSDACVYTRGSVRRASGFVLTGQP